MLHLDTGRRKRQLESVFLIYNTTIDRNKGIEATVGGQVTAGKCVLQKRQIQQCGEREEDHEANDIVAGRYERTRGQGRVNACTV